MAEQNVQSFQSDPSYEDVVFPSDPNSPTLTDDLLTWVEHNLSVNFNSLLGNTEGMLQAVTSTAGEIGKAINSNVGKQVTSVTRTVNRLKAKVDKAIQQSPILDPSAGSELLNAGIDHDVSTGAGAETPPVPIPNPDCFDGQTRQIPDPANPNCFFNQVCQEGVWLTIGSVCNPPPPSPPPPPGPPPAPPPTNTYTCSGIWPADGTTSDCRPFDWPTLFHSTGQDLWQDILDDRYLEFSQETTLAKYTSGSQGDNHWAIPVKTYEIDHFPDGKCTYDLPGFWERMFGNLGPAPTSYASNYANISTWDDYKRPLSTYVSGAIQDQSDIFAIDSLIAWSNDRQQNGVTV